MTLRARIYDEEFEFHDREFVTIGRDPAADITVKSPIASRQHAVIRRTGDGWGIFNWAAQSRCNPAAGPSTFTACRLLLARWS